jgi:hypothetical protein
MAGDHSAHHVVFGLGVFSVYFNPLAIESVEAIPGADPHKTDRILVNVWIHGLGKSMGGCQVVKVQTVLLRVGTLKTYKGQEQKQEKPPWAGGACSGGEVIFGFDHWIIWSKEMVTIRVGI